jgi:hypothetical protein
MPGIENKLAKYRWWSIGTNRGEIGTGQGPLEFFVTLKFDMGCSSNCEFFKGWGKTVDEAFDNAEKKIPAQVLKVSGSFLGNR